MVVGAVGGRGEVPRGGPEGGGGGYAEVATLSSKPTNFAATYGCLLLRPPSFPRSQTYMSATRETLPVSVLACCPCVWRYRRRGFWGLQIYPSLEIPT